MDLNINTEFILEGGIIIIDFNDYNLYYSKRAVNGGYMYVFETQTEILPIFCESNIYSSLMQVYYRNEYSMWAKPYN